MTARGSSIRTCWPGFAVSSVTVPSAGAVTVCSIFIASTTASGCPAVTCSPAVTCTVSTVPGIGERTMLSAFAAWPLRAGAAGSSVSAQARPSRPSHVVMPSLAQANRSVRPP
jgi:hypothetical protein